MNWNSETQTRFDQLRASQLAGALSTPEEAELAELAAALEADETRRLAPSLNQVRVEQTTLRERLQATQSENEELARLLNQQEQLVTDARRWLAQFEQRHRLIQQTYTRLTGEVLVVSPLA